MVFFLPVAAQNNFHHHSPSNWIEMHIPYDSFHVVSRLGLVFLFALTESRLSDCNCFSTNCSRGETRGEGRWSSHGVSPAAAQTGLLHCKYWSTPLVILNYRTEQLLARYAPFVMVVEDIFSGELSLGGVSQHCFYPSGSRTWSCLLIVGRAETFIQHAC